MKTRGALVLADVSLRNPVWTFLQLSGGKLPLDKLKGPNKRSDDESRPTAKLRPASASAAVEEASVHTVANSALSRTSDADTVPMSPITHPVDLILWQFLGGKIATDLLPVVASGAGSGNPIIAAAPPSSVSSEFGTVTLAEENDNMWIDLSERSLTVEDVVVIGRLLWENSTATALDLSLNDIAGAKGDVRCATRIVCPSVAWPCLTTYCAVAATRWYSVALRSH